VQYKLYNILLTWKDVFSIDEKYLLEQIFSLKKIILSKLFIIVCFLLNYL
jgi:hypothetical protein